LKIGKGDQKQRSKDWHTRGREVLGFHLRWKKKESPWKTRAGGKAYWTMRQGGEVTKGYDLHS